MTRELPPPDAADINSSGRSERHISVPGWILWLLSKWYALVFFVLLALGGNLLVVPLSQGLDHWGTGVQIQIAALLSFASAHPVATVAIVLALTLLTGLGYLVDKQPAAIEKMANRVKHRAENQSDMRAVLQETVIPVLDDQAATQQRLAARQGQLAVGEAAMMMQGAATYANTEEILAKVTRLERARAVTAPNLEQLAGASGLPLPVSLIGRDAVLAELLASLRRGDSMGVFALEGMGGVGKSALAATAVAMLASDRMTFPGGAAWIPCDGWLALRD
jgi:nitrogen fixation/metabolism regulation signal transduction histidine kinase